MTAKRTTSAAPAARLVVPAAPPGSPIGAGAALSSAPPRRSPGGEQAPRAGRPAAGPRGALKTSPAGVSGGSAPAGDPRTWTITFPAGMEVLTGNNRLSRHPKAGIARELRRQGWIGGRRLPQIGRADIHVTYLPPPRLLKDRHPFASARVEDSDALWPTGKHLIDGIADAGTFGGGDSRKHVLRVTYELLPGTCPRGQVTLHITEIGGDQ
jgi:hypothetical protein